MEDRIPGPDNLRAVQVRLPGEASNAKDAVVFAYVGQARYPVDVHDIFRHGQLQLHQRDQALASGQHDGFGAVLLEQGDRLLQRFGGEVLEFGWYHEALLFRLGVIM